MKCRTTTVAHKCRTTTVAHKCRATTVAHNKFTARTTSSRHGQVHGTNEKATARTETPRHKSEWGGAEVVTACLSLSRRGRRRNRWTGRKGLSERSVLERVTESVSDLYISNSLIIHKIKTKEINTETEFGYVMKHLHKIKPTFISIFPLNTNLFEMLYQILGRVFHQDIQTPRSC